MSVLTSGNKWINPNTKELYNPNFVSTDSLIPRSHSYKTNFNEDLVFQENFYNEYDDVKLTEEDKAYKIHFKDDSIHKKEMKLDFNKDENEIRILIIENSEPTIDEYGNDVNHTNNFESVIKFDKPIDIDRLTYEPNDGDVEILIPKK